MANIVEHGLPELLDFACKTCCYVGAEYGERSTLKVFVDSSLVHPAKPQKGISKLNLEYVELLPSADDIRGVLNQLV